MKIWCQSMSPLAKDKLFSAYQNSLERHLREVARQGTTVDLYGTDFTIPGVDRYRAALSIGLHQIVRNAIHAEEKGYDVFIMLGTSDIGFYEVRELVSIPVVFISEATLHLACLLGDKFGFLGHNESVLRRRTPLVEQYGLTHRMVAGSHLDLTYDNFRDMFENPKRYIDMVMKAAREVAARGASIILPNALPLNQWLVDNKLREIDGATILDLSGSVLKMAELMVDLKAIGVNRSRRGDYTPPPSDMLMALKKLYGTE